MDKISLLIMNCPYCGGHDIAEISRIESHLVEMAVILCLTCDEVCCIDRNLDDNEENKTNE